MKKSNVVLVCVTPQLSCKNLIAVGKALADETDAAVRILCVFPKKQCFNPNIEALETLSAMAGDIGAEMTVSFSDSPVESAAGFARDFGVSSVITGFPGEHSSDFVTALHSLLPEMPLSMVDSDGTAYSINSVNRERSKTTAANAQEQFVFNRK